jgi:multiple sugar transport system substrate-binding protein
MAANPDIEVKLDAESASLDKFVTMIAAGTPPDVGFSTLYNWPSFAEKDIFIPLDDYIAAESYDLEDFYPQIIKPYQYNGDVYGEGPLYGLPKEIAIRAMYFNQDIFTEAGVEIPTADTPWTWDQFVDMTQKTTKEEGGRVRQFGYIQDTRWTFWQIWAWSAGGEPVDDLFKPTKSTLDNPAVLEGYQVFTDFVTKLKTAPSASVAADQGISELFASGRGATYNNGRWMVPLFREADFTWDVMPHPIKTQRAQTLSGSMFGICKGSQNPDAAWKLLSYIVGVEGQTKMTESGLLLPSRKSVAESDLFLKSTPPTNNQIFLDELEFAKPLPLTPIYPELDKVINDQTDLVLGGEKTAAEAIAEMHTQFNTLLGAT